jgi:pyruvate ferredoxin oxidoreductase beta subunit
MGVNCGLVPLFEKQNGAITAVRKIKKKIPVAEYLKQQKRYSHLFANEQGLAELKKLQAMADRNIEKYRLREGI